MGVPLKQVEINKSLFVAVPTPSLGLSAGGTSRYFLSVPPGWAREPVV